ncbi:unnamed protein product [Rangifer tarandus platyrhynchus]|uniref:Uncharacterized protein n=1 Tax=Rangifer tarandus platyrhynchus TaxID=3082113 RepID=A0ABN8YIH4_RANTA|nr:unnamed protein product [Rangifer tarandus platyrhynchus]
MPVEGPWTQSQLSLCSHSWAPGHLGGQRPVNNTQAQCQERRAADLSALEPPLVQPHSQGSWGPSLEFLSPRSHLALRLGSQLRARAALLTEGSLGAVLYAPHVSSSPTSAAETQPRAVSGCAQEELVTAGDKLMVPTRVGPGFSNLSQRGRPTNTSY